MSRRKTRGVTLGVVAPNGDLTNRGWQITARQERAVLDLLGPPDLETIITADQVSEIHELFHDLDLPVLEGAADLDADAVDAEFASGRRSLVGAITADGNVQMMIIVGVVPPSDEPQSVPMVPNASVIIKAEEFTRWLDGMKQWWETNR